MLRSLILGGVVVLVVILSKPWKKDKEESGNVAETVLVDTFGGSFSNSDKRLIYKGANKNRFSGTPDNSFVLK